MKNDPDETEGRKLYRTRAGRPPIRNPSLVKFLQTWANGPIPIDILCAGAEIMEAEEYTPEKRVHQIVQKCIILWMEHDAAGLAALATDARTGTGEEGVELKLDTPSEWTSDRLHRPTLERCAEEAAEYIQGKGAAQGIRALAEPQEKP